MIQNYTKKQLIALTKSTGLEFDIYSKKDKKLVFETFEVDYDFLPKECENDYVFADTKQGLTYFSINGRNNESYIGVLYGCNDTIKNYALLIQKLIENLEQNETAKSKNNILQDFIGSNLTIAENNYLRGLITLDFDFYLYCIFLTQENHKKEVLDNLDIICDEKDYYINYGKNIVLLKSVSEYYKNAMEYAKILYDILRAEINFDFEIVYGGLVKDYNDINKNLRVAEEAYNIAIQDSRHCIISYSDYVLHDILASFQKDKLNNYLEKILSEGNKQVFENKELMNTAQSFIDNSFSIAKTCEAELLHKNTILHRLNEIKKELRLDLNNFNEAMIFRISYTIYKLLNKKTKKKKKVLSHS